MSDMENKTVPGLTWDVDEMLRATWKCWDEKSKGDPVVFLNEYFTHKGAVREEVREILSRRRLSPDQIQDLLVEVLVITAPMYKRYYL
jgi:hypothetical protein